MNYLKSNFLSLIILIAMVGVSFYLYPDLPDQIPSSFDLDGTVQDYSSKNLMVVLLPLIYAILLVVINLLIRVSPQKFSMPNSKQAMDIIMFGIGVYFLFIHLDLLNRNQDSSETGFYISLGAGLFLIIVGNVFGKTERNFFIGLRTPWTLASTDNWPCHAQTGREALRNRGRTNIGRKQLSQQHVDYRRPGRKRYHHSRYLLIGLLPEI